jgi:hypothetical protein
VGGNSKAFEEECGPEFTLDLAIEMYECYCMLVLINLCMVRGLDRNLCSMSATEFHAFAPLEALPCVRMPFLTGVHSSYQLPLVNSVQTKGRTFLHGFCTGATKKNTLNVAFESPHWFWAMVLYFSPLDDAALPLLMECVRQVVAEFGHLSGQPDYILGPATAMVELLHWGITTSGGCHYPPILWMRIVVCIEGVLVGFQNILSLLQSRRDNSGGWVRSCSGGKQTVTMYRPHRSTADDGVAASRQELLTDNVVPQQFHNRGWVIKKVEVRRSRV